MTFIGIRIEILLFYHMILFSCSGVLQNEFTEVQEAFQHCHGLGLRELALLAASLDELVHQEVLLHVKDVFKAKKRPVFGHIKVLEMQKILEEAPQNI